MSAAAAAAAIASSNQPSAAPSSSSSSSSRRHHKKPSSSSSSNKRKRESKSKHNDHHHSSKYKYIPTLEEVKEGGKQRSQKQRSQFLTHATPQNTIPTLPNTTNSLAMPTADDQWYRYASAALSAQVPLQAHYDGKLGVPIDLMEMSQPTDTPLEAPDQRVLAGFSERTVLANQKANGLNPSARTRSSTGGGGVGGGGSIGVSRPKGTKASQPVTWLRKTRMLANDMSARQQQQQQQQAPATPGVAAGANKNASSSSAALTATPVMGSGDLMASVVAETSTVSVEQQVARVEHSFNVSMRRPVHPEDASIRQVEVSSLQPDEDLVRLHHCMHLMFDTSPTDVLMSRRERSGGAKCARANTKETAREMMEASVLSRHSQKAFGLYVPSEEYNMPAMPEMLRLTKSEVELIQPPNFTWPTDNNNDGGDGDDAAADDEDGEKKNNADTDAAVKEDKKRQQQRLEVPIAGAKAPTRRILYEWAREYILKPETMPRPLTYFCLGEGSARYGQYTGRWRLRKRGGADRATEAPIGTRPELLVFNQYDSSSSS